MKPGLYGAHGDFQDSGDLFIGYILKIFQQDNHRIVGFEAVQSVLYSILNFFLRHNFRRIKAVTAYWLHCL